MEAITIRWCDPFGRPESASEQSQYCYAIGITACEKQENAQTTHNPNRPAYDEPYLKGSTYCKESPLNQRSWNEAEERSKHQFEGHCNEIPEQQNQGRPGAILLKPVAESHEATPSWVISSPAA